MNMAIVLLSGIFISYFAVCVYGAIKEEGREWREEEKEKRGDEHRGEREGWMEWMNNFISKKNLILLNFTDQFKFQAVETLNKLRCETYS